MRPLRHHAAPARRGLSLVEMILTLTIVVVAAGMLSRTLVGTGGMRAVSRETALAAEGARTMLETMRAQPFEDLWRLYNADPLDDPGGPGTAPGDAFAVPDLEPVPGDGGLVGRIELPARLVEVQVEGAPTQSPKGKTKGKGTRSAPAGSTLTSQEWQLREDLVDAKLGFPRDLNGDNVVDTLDHGDDYLILPVRLTVTWTGLHGPRSTSFYAALTEMRTQP